MKWFGPHWGAPVCQYEDQVEVPIGEPCEMCAEHFDSTSQGIMMAFWDKSFWRDYPVHLDCLMRSVLGPDAPA